MAQSSFNQDKFTPTTKQTLLYSDLFDSFLVHPEIHDLVIRKNEDSVKQAVMNIIMTNKYERPFNPNFGSNIRNYLFEQMTSLTQQGIQTEIENAIANFEPRAQNVNVSVKADEEHNAYNVFVSFYIINRTNPVSLSTILYRAR
jgi:phage baseplate assembly protein W